VRLLLLLLVALACATARAPRAPAGEDPAALTFREGDVVTPAPLDAELAGKNDEELFAIGTAAYAAGDHARAAAAFERVADLFPASRHRATALYDAGLAERQLERWDRALERFRQLADGWAGPDADEARFFVAEGLYRTGRHAEARAELEALAARSDLGAAQHVRALVERGVIELEDGELDLAERSLKLGAAAWQLAAERERLDAAQAAKAQFYLGEVGRARFQAVRLDPAGDEAGLAARLEEKAQLLLSAQGHYLRAVRAGDGGWAVAAGARVGELYEELHAHLVEAPLPAGLDEEAATAYREALRERVRVLVAKAVVAYEETLSAARRAGVDNAFVPRAEEALRRLRKILAEDAGRDTVGG
jgi:tetratricopeptide (TPR) repeat protein